MRQPIYLVVGTPGSGKSWVCNQLKEKFKYLPHDEYMNDDLYVKAAARMAGHYLSPILIETPFSVSKIYEPLLKQGFTVIPVFIIETKQVTTERYEARENKPIPKGHLSRINTYVERAREMDAFQGTSEEVLEHLKAVK